MELQLGTDIIEIDRVREAMSDGGGDRFRNRVFTEEEVAYCESKHALKYQSYAARFAGKEAISKAMGTGIGRHASFNEIEILNDELGKPYVRLHGKAAEYFKQMGGTGISITLSHCKEYAVAYAAIYSA